MKISCVIPAHNEESNLEKLIKELVSTLERYDNTKDYELIIVNDNSTDKTGILAESYSKQNSRIKVVHRKERPGFGNAIKTGLKHANGDIIIPVMGDLSDDPEDTPKLVRKIEEGYDVVYGSRFIEGGKTEGYPALKMFYNRLYNNVVRLLFGLRHKDVTNAFKAYRREVLDAIGIDNLKSESFDLTVEIPLKAHILGFKSAEVPVTWHGRKRGVSKLKISRTGPSYVKRLLEMFILGNIVALKDLFGAVVRGSKLRLIWAMLFGVIVLIGLFSLSGFSETFEIIKNVSILYLTVGCIMLLLSFFLRTWRWSVMLRASGFTAHRDILFKCIMLGWFLNYLLPARVGDIARGFALKTTEKIPFSLSFSTIVVERLMDLITLIFLLSFGLYLFVQKEVLGTLNLLALFLAVLLFFSLFTIYRFDTLLVNKLSPQIPSIGSAIDTIKQGLKEMVRNPQALILCLMLSFPIWLLELSSIFFAAKAIGHNLSIMLTLVSGISAFIAQAIPTTPAGIGIHEASITGILVLFDVPLKIGTSIALVDHFARAIVIYLFGSISTMHIAFQSREYFKQRAQVNKDGEE